MDILSNVLSYSKLLFDENNHGFKFFKNGNTTLLSTSFGVQINFLLDSLEHYPTNTIAMAIKAQQDPRTGFFPDKQFSISDVEGFEEEYILWQFTYFAVIALDMLDDSPNHRFDFLNNLRDRDLLEKWLNEQDFQKFWRTSNKLMFLLYFLTYEQERLGVNNKMLIDLVFDFLDLKQDVTSGFWGIKDGASLENGMFGASHIYLYYVFHNRKIKFTENIIESVTGLQNSYGLFGSKFGGACEDYDGIEILSRLIKHRDYMSDPVRKVVQKTYEMILKYQNSDGGFPYNIDTRSFLRKLRDTFKRKKYFYKYSGWKKMISSCFQSDLWATYFRTLTIAKIETMLKINENKKYRFYSLPGWGY